MVVLLKALFCHYVRRYIARYNIGDELYNASELPSFVGQPVVYRPYFFVGHPVKFVGHIVSNFLDILLTSYI